MSNPTVAPAQQSPYDSLSVQDLSDWLNTVVNTDSEREIGRQALEQRVLEVGHPLSEAELREFYIEEIQQRQSDGSIPTILEGIPNKKKFRNRSKIPKSFSAIQCPLRYGRS